MEQLKISIENSKKNFLPGETIRGTVSWDCPKTPKDVELRLRWLTSGKGTQDLYLVQKTSYQPLNNSENHNFEFKLPESPYSFSGKLVSLSWALELQAFPSDNVSLEEFVLSPFGQEIVLHSGT
jgi:hypothetical protein